MIPQWVMLLKADDGLSPAGFMIYCLLLAHVNTSRGDGRTWLTQEAIGKMLGMHPNSVGRLINGELAQLGLVDVSTHRYGDNNTRKRNVYTINEVPEDSFTGYRSLAAWHAANRTEIDETPTYIATNAQVSTQDTGSNLTQTPDSTSVVAPDSTCVLSPEATHRLDKQEEAKTRFLPPPPSSVGSRRDEDEEKGSPAGQDGTEDDEAIEVTADDVLLAKRLFGSVPWPGRGVIGARKKREILDRLAMMAAGGWTEEMVHDYVKGRIPDWTAVKSPADLVAFVLNDSPLRVSEAFTAPVEPREDDELTQAQEEAERLEVQHAQQKLVIAECIECDELGYVMPFGKGSIEWHGHGSMNLSSLKRKAQARAAQIAEERRSGETPWEVAS
jgi:hypothetical protein